MTKAERIFEETYKMNRRMVRRNVEGVASLEYGDNEHICQRTINDLRKILARKVQQLESHVKMCEKYGTTDERSERLNSMEREVLNRMSVAIDRAQRMLDSDKAFLCSL